MGSLKTGVVRWTVTPSFVTMHLPWSQVSGRHPSGANTRFSLSIRTASASPHEVTLVAEMLTEEFFGATPEKLRGDHAYESDPLDAELRAMGIEMIAPHHTHHDNEK